MGIHLVPMMPKYFLEIWRIKLKYIMLGPMSIMSNVFTENIIFYKTTIKIELVVRNMLDKPTNKKFVLVQKLLLNRSKTL